MENPYVELDKKFLDFIQKLLDQIFEEIKSVERYQWATSSVKSFKVINGDREKNGRIYIDLDVVAKSETMASYVADFFEIKLREKTGLRVLLDVNNVQIVKTIKENREIPEDKLKKYFFSYWKKHGARLDPVIYEVVGKEWGTGKFWDVSIDWLQEFLGGKESAYDLAMNIIESANHKIEDCSSLQLNFNFKIDEVTFFPSENFIHIGIKIDDNGYFMEEGKKYNLSLLDDTFFNEYTFQDCIDTFFENLEVQNLTGINLEVYTSGSY